MANIDKLKSLTQEILGEEKLLELIEKAKSGEKVYHYIGYEVSGRPHIGHGILCMMVIKELQNLGIHCRIFIADWHAWLNNKLGGNWELISGTGVKLFKEYMLAGAKCVGVKLDGENPLEFIEGSKLYSGKYEHINSNPLAFWEIFVKVSKNTTLNRIQRSIDIMGRKDGDIVNFASLIYPPMQAADIFFMGNEIAHGGMDQRKIHVVAIDIANQMPFKPVAIHHKLVLGLQAPSLETIEKAKHGEEISVEDIKMSKSKPNTAIFMDDTELEIRSKIKSAYCPEGDILLNPILDWCEHIVFKIGKLNDNENILDIKRKVEWGGDINYNDFEILKNDYINKNLHPMDLKNAVADYFVKLMKPATDHLNTEYLKDMKKEVEEKSK